MMHTTVDCPDCGYSYPAVAHYDTGARWISEEQTAKHAAGHVTCPDCGAVTHEDHAADHARLDCTGRRCGYCDGYGSTCRATSCGDYDEPCPECTGTGAEPDGPVTRFQVKAAVQRYRDLLLPLPEALVKLANSKHVPIP